MRSLLFAATSTAFFSASLFAEPSLLPETPGFDRYEEMLRQSLFAPVTVVVQEAPVEKPSWSAPLFVVGAHEFAGVSHAVVENRDTGERYMLKTGVEGPEGMSLASVEWSKATGQSKVTIRRGGEFATLSFDQAQLVQELVSQPVDVESALRNRSQIGSPGGAQPMPMPNPHMASPDVYPNRTGPVNPPNRRRRIIQAPSANGEAIPSP